MVRVYIYNVIVLTLHCDVLPFFPKHRLLVVEKMQYHSSIRTTPIQF